MNKIEKKNPNPDAKLQFKTILNKYPAFWNTKTVRFQGNSQAIKQQ